MNFKDYVNASIRGSPSLTDAEIIDAIAENNKAKLYAYASRVAAFGAIYCQRFASVEVDESDWIDAQQECLANFEVILSKWSAPRGPFFRYLTYCFRDKMLQYVRGLANGGTGSARTDADFVTSIDATQYIDLPDDTGYSDEIEHYENLTNDESAPFGMRDPLIEALAEEQAEKAIIYNALHGKRTNDPDSEGKPISRSEAFMLRRKKNSLVSSNSSV